jgi:hypothetical protein
MKMRTAFLLLAPAMVFLLTASSLQSAETNLKVLVLIVPAKDFKTKYRYDTSTDTYKGGSRVYDIQDDLNYLLEKRLSSGKSGISWDAVFCKSSKEFEENIGKPDSYLAIRVEIAEYKRTYKSTATKYRTYSELGVNCEVHRKSGTAWAKVFSKNLSSKSSEPDDEEYYVSSAERMAEYLDTVLLNQVVSYQMISAVAKDSNTKAVKAKVMNLSPLPIQRLKWVIPMENDNISSTTEGVIKPGETVEVTIIIRSERSHAATQWRNAYVSTIEFGKSGDN